MNKPIEYLRELVEEVLAEENNTQDMGPHTAGHVVRAEETTLSVANMTQYPLKLTTKVVNGVVFVELR